MPAAAYVWLAGVPFPVWASPKLQVREAMDPSVSELRSVKLQVRSVQLNVKSAVGDELVSDSRLASLHAASSAAPVSRVRIRGERIVGSKPPG